MGANLDFCLTNIPNEVTETRVMPALSDRLGIRVSDHNVVKIETTIKNKHVFKKHYKKFVKYTDKRAEEVKKRMIRVDWVGEFDQIPDCAAKLTGKMDEVCLLYTSPSPRD